MPEIIYMDNAASTRLDERVLEAMRPYFFESYAVATSEFGHSMGIEAKETLEKARSSLANTLGISPEELVLTSGDTESSNLAIKGVALSLGDKKGKHIVTSKIEDFPVLNSVKAMERYGYKATYLPVDREGILDLGELERSITKETILVSIQHSNQEIGTVQDIAALGKLCHEKGALFHVDATHTYRRLGIDLAKLPVDLMTFSAHTIHGPKGIGGLFVRKGTPLGKWMDGGFQEFNLRAGLENIPAAVGFAKAAELVTSEENERLASIRDKLITRLLDEVPETTLNGHRSKRIPQNANITFHYVEGESITLHLDMRGIEVSTGSACFSRSLEASHVIMGIGGNHERAHGSIRYSLGRFNRMEEVEVVVAAMKEVIFRLREISPLRKEEKT
ncbi:MAG: cysteine desulfurase [Methanomassiliicoccales archaeon]|nr:cysteine desulfurase [Methanomassiliicoccales archaeon]MDD1756340.1 cysteine desulfurase [Methanomassiliicoccales archaeon]